MKKILLFTIICIGLTSCKTQSVTSTKLDNKTEVALKGNWTLSSVKYVGAEYFKVNSFDLADSKCFEGSKWAFISNNNKGNMELTNNGCTNFASPITWYVNKEGKLILKIIDAGGKAKKVRDGYILDLRNVTPNSFELVDKINVGGKLSDVVYEFIKN
jgi:hypothetical protein